MQAIFLVTLAVICAALAVFLPLFRDAKIYSFFRDLPETGCTWIRLVLLFPDLNKRIKHADQIQAKLTARPMQATHWSNEESKAVDVHVVRIDVPVGCVAVLGSPTIEGTTVLDSSAFCTFHGFSQKELTIWLLRKSARWQARVTKMLPALDTLADDAGIRFHVAVHTTLIEKDDLQRLSGLTAECEAYVEKVQSWIEETLAAFVAGQNYFYITRHPDHLVAVLNEKWRAAEQNVFPHLSGLIQTTITGVVPKLLQYFEDGRFRAYLQQIEGMRQRREELELEFRIINNVYRQKLMALLGGMRGKFESIAGFRWRVDGGNNDLYNETPSASADAEPRALSLKLQERMNNVISISSKNFQNSVVTVDEAYKEVRQTIDQNLDQFCASAKQLALFIEELNEEIQASAQALDSRQGEIAADDTGAPIK